jgi:hypothetical protein
MGLGMKDFNGKQTRPSALAATFAPSVVQPSVSATV